MAKITINSERCKGCGLCTSACPKKIMHMTPEKLNSKGYYYAYLSDEAECVGCAMCAIMCPDCVIAVEPA